MQVLNNAFVFINISAIDKTVIMVTCYDPVDDHLYGIAWDKRSFMISKDQGTTWASVSSTKFYQVYNTAGTVKDINVPMVKDMVRLDPSSASTHVDFDTGSGYGGMLLFSFKF